MFRRQLVISILCLSVLAGCGGGSGGPAATRYTITDLGYATAVYGLNKSGKILLTTSRPQDATPTPQNFLVSGNSRVEVDTLGGVAVRVLALNDSGQMFGTLVSANSSGGTDWFLYTGGVLTVLTALRGTNFSGGAFNNSGQVAGITQQPPSNPPPSGGPPPNPQPNPIHLVVYSGGTLTDLGTVFGATSGSVVAINDSGQITGTYLDSQGGTHAFLYANGQISDIGTLGGPYTVPVTINNQGQITGKSLLSYNGQQHTFTYAAGKMVDLDQGSTINYSAPTGMNNQGQVVGWDNLNPDVGFGYFSLLYTNGKSINLNSQIPANSGWVLIGPTGINDRGQIIGLGDLNGVQHAFLLTPQ